MNKETEQSFFRSIQDRFRLFEKKGFSFYPEVQPSFASKIQNCIKPKTEKIKEKTGYVYSDVIEAQVVIPLFGKSEMLLECIKSIENSIGVKSKVVLVDNGCETVVLENAEQFSSVQHVIINEKNNGYGHGCHQGIEHFSSGNIILLNSDAVLQPQSLRELLNALDSNEHIAVACSIPINTDDTIQEYGRVMQNDGHSLAIDEDQSVDTLKQNIVESVPYASFVCAAIKSNYYTKIGGFDKEFSPAYSEDIDLCLRFWNENKATVIASNSIVAHVAGDSSSQLSDIEKIKKQNREYLVKKHSKVLTQLIDAVDTNDYPHEINLLKKPFFRKTILLITDGNIAISELEKATGIKSEFWPLNSIFLSAKSQPKNSVELISKGISINEWKNNIVTHHFLRNRIGYFDKVLIGVTPHDDLNLQMAFYTQPFAEFEMLQNYEN